MANVTSRSRSGKERQDGSLQLDVMFRAVCDRTRVRILNVLRNGELCVGDIVQIIQAPQPRASRHLAYLKKRGSSWLAATASGSTIRWPRCVRSSTASS